MFERALQGIMLTGLTVMVIMTIFASILAHMELR